MSEDQGRPRHRTVLVQGSPEEKLLAQLHKYVIEPCCQTPLEQPNPGCAWHGYRAVHRQVAALLPELKAVETRAMVHALTFFREAVLQDKIQQYQGDLTPELSLLVDLNAALNRLIQQCGGEVG